MAGRHRAGHRLVLARSSRPGDAPWTVLADPEGNELCVLPSPSPADRLDEPGTQRGVVVAGELGVALCTKQALDLLFCGN